MNDLEVQWTTPSPLWGSVADLSDETRQFFRQPAILRFATDSFMNDFQGMLQSNPMQMKDLRARRETWRGPDDLVEVQSTEQLPKFTQKLIRARLLKQGAAGGRTPMPLKISTADRPLKLYQPAHQRYYLISAALVCRIAGLPDRRIETSDQERATFVVRKVVPRDNTTIFENDESTWQEYAFVGNGWLKLDDVRTLAPQEDQNPLFGVNYFQEEGRRRRVLAGLIPVGRREAYIGAPERARNHQIVPDPLRPMPDPRTLLFMAQVAEPWKRLIERGFAWEKMKEPDKTLTDDKDLAGPALDKSVKDNREQMQTTSWYALLDFAKFLRQHIPNVWEKIMGLPPSKPLTTGQDNLIAALDQAQIPDSFASDTNCPQDLLCPDYEGRSVAPATVVKTLCAALQQIQGGLPFDPEKAEQIETKLEKVVTPYDRNPASGTDISAWPNFLFPLADPVQTDPFSTWPLPPPKAGQEDEKPLTAALDRIDHLVNLIELALPAQVADRAPLPMIASQPVMGVDTLAYFIIRCVFERPNCGPLSPTLVSDATEPFLMAGFFDPDAPARPIRIGLPVDTTPAGLRKFDKNTAFMISDVLCGQIDRAKGLGLGDLVRSVLPWPLHKDLSVPDTGPCKDENNPSLGMICSLSIPIITICALILLMIMVGLLDFIFRWMPYFIMCLPIPKFNGKQSTG